MKYCHYLDFSSCLYERDSIRIMLLDAGGYGQDVGIEDDVVTIEFNFLNQNVVGSGANLHFPWGICSLKVKSLQLSP